MSDNQNSVEATATDNNVIVTNSPCDVQYIVSALDTPDDIGHIFSRSNIADDIETDVAALDTLDDIGHIFSRSSNLGDIETDVAAFDTLDDIGHIFSRSSNPGDIETAIAASDTLDDIGHIFSRSSNPGDIETAVAASDTLDDIGHIFSRSSNPGDTETAVAASDTLDDIGHIFSRSSNPGDIETAVSASDTPCVIDTAVSTSDTRGDIGQNNAEAAVFTSDTRGDIGQNIAEAAVFTLDTRGDIGQNNAEAAVFTSDTRCNIGQTIAEAADFTSDTRGDIGQNNAEAAVFTSDTRGDIGQNNAEAAVSTSNTPGDIGQKNAEAAVSTSDTWDDIGKNIAEAAVFTSDTPNNIEHIFSRTNNLGDVEAAMPDDIGTVMSISHNPGDIESVIYAATNPCASETPANIRNINPASNNPFSVSMNPGEIDNVSFLWKLRHDDEYRIRFIHTTSVVWMFITLGWNASIVGGTFPDLRLIIKKDLETASWLFTLGSLGFLFGALLGGLIFDRINRLLMLVTVTVLNAVSIAAMPWCSTFPAMLAVSCVYGFFSGVIDVGGNSHIASIWGQKAAPFMQSIHFGFSFGGIISPLTAEPFLAPKSCPAPETNMTAVFEITTMLDTNTTECEEIYGETHIRYAYLIAGIISLSASLPFFVLYMCSKSHNTYVSTPITATAGFKEDKSTELATLTLSKSVLFVVFLVLLISVYACTENRFSSLLTTFLTEHLGWSTKEGLHVTSLFWGTFAAGRFLGIIITRFLKTPTMILVYLVSLTLSFIGLSFAAMYEVREGVWACAALAGLSMSVIFPSVFTWTAESILTVTGIISAAYLVGVSVFNMLMSLLYGYLMDNFTQMYFVDLLIAQCVVSVCIYIVIRALIKLCIKPRQTDVPDWKVMPQMLY